MNHQTSNLIGGCIRAGVACVLVIAASAVLAAQDQPAERGVVDRLIMDLKGADPVARRKALESLVEMGPSAAPAVPALIGVLGDSDEINRDFAVTTLSHIGSAAEPAIPALRRVAQSDPSDQIRQLAKAAIGEISAAMPAAPPAIPQPPSAPAVPAPPAGGQVAAPPQTHDRLSKDAYVGVYRGDNLTITLAASPSNAGDYTGTIKMGGTTYPFQGEFIADLVIGTFQSEGNPFGCTFSLENRNALRFETGTSTYTLRREGENPALPKEAANPLAQGATASPAPAAGAPIPAEFRVAAQTATGRALVTQMPRANSAKAAILAAAKAIAPAFESKPQLLGAVGDQQDRRAVATFSATINGQDVEGSIVAGVADSGAATVSVLYDRKGASRRERSLLAAGLPSPVPEVQWQTATLSDGSATVKIPSDWRLASGQRAMCTLQGSAGQEINLGIALSVVTPELGEYRRRMTEQMGIPPQPQLIAVPDDPVQAYVRVMEQMNQMVPNQPPTRVVAILGAKPVSNRDNWPSAFVDCLLEVGSGRSAQPHRAIAMVICSPASGGQWMLHLSQMKAPIAAFERDLPTMMEIWGGWGVSPAETRRRLDEATASMNATTEILRRAREERAAHEAARKHAQQRDHADPNADFDEAIRGWRTVEDTLTGERKQVSLGDVDDIVKALNEREGWGRYQGIPLRNEWP